MASFASSATTGGARKHAWTKTMASLASSATTGGACKHAWTKERCQVHFSSDLLQGFWLSYELVRPWLIQINLKLQNSQLCS